MVGAGSVGACHRVGRGRSAALGSMGGKEGENVVRVRRGRLLGVVGAGRGVWYGVQVCWWMGGWG